MPKDVTAGTGTKTTSSGGGDGGVGGDGKEATFTEIPLWRDGSTGYRKLSNSTSTTIESLGSGEKQPMKGLLFNPALGPPDDISNLKHKRSDARKESRAFNSNEWPTLLELRKLMESRGAEAVIKLTNEFGDAEGLCKRLDVDPIRGLPKAEAELECRRNKYGQNTVPTAKSKSFWRLVFDASRDPTLIILIVAGFISLGLSFVPADESDIRMAMAHQQNQSTHFNGTNHSNGTLQNNGTADHFRISGNASLPKPPDIGQGQAMEGGEEDKNKQEDHGSAWIEGVAILICVAVVVLVTAINDYSKERQFRGLQAKIVTGHTHSVIRNGEAFNVPVSELVVGDLIRVKYGDMIPADGILLQSSDLKVDESTLTGESDHVRKSVESDPVLLSGTYAMEGSGKMVVTAVGVNSQTGIIMTLLSGGRPEGESESDSSSSSSSSDSSSSSSSDSSSRGGSDSSKDSKTEPEGDECGLHSKSILQTKLSALALKIIYLGTSVAVVALIVLVVRFCIQEYRLEGNVFNFSHIHQFVKFFIIAVTILVISIPEGLPLAIALSLTYSVKKMMNDNNLVRHLDACETMGNATTICSDKTGTLTTNRMTCVRSYVCGKDYEGERRQPTAGNLPPGFASFLSEAIAINSAYNSMVAEPTKPGERVQQLGNKTECAMLGWISRMGGDYAALRRRHPEESHVRVYTFNSFRKSMMTVVRLCEGNNFVGYRLYCKGASEILLSKCSHFVGAQGAPEPFTEEARERLRNVVHSMALQGLRTILVAYKNYVLEGARKATESEVQIASEDSVDWEDEQGIGGELVGMAICGIQDPVREEVPHAIDRCRRAGITVRMVTGDNVNTARAIAQQCGIIKPGEDCLVLEGREFNERIRDEKTGRISQERMDEVWPRLRVLARAQPVDKYNLVKGIIDSKSTTNREIVAVTGDGTNDGPALKKADVGFAMGIAGTDVAKEASDIIITDDNFTSIVRAVMWGRNVYDSISKFLQFQLTVNIVAVLTAFISACAIADSPLKAVHMLWINLIMDTFASLALATEPPTDELLNRKPYGRKKSLISRTMFKNIICHAVYQLAVLMLLLFKGAEWFGIESGFDFSSPYSPPTQHFTIVFNTFVMMTLFNEINCRKVHGERNVFKHLSSNRTFCVIWTSTFLAQIAIVHFGGKWFSTAQLDINQWLVCFGIGLSELLFGQVVATIPSKRLPKWMAFLRGVHTPSPLTLHRRQEGQLQLAPARPKSRGHALWLRGIQLIGMHYRVYRALHETLRERRLGMTAPKMTSEAAEHWRASYRRYRQRKHAEKRFKKDSVAIAMDQLDGGANGVAITTTNYGAIAMTPASGSANYHHSVSAANAIMTGAAHPPRTKSEPVALSSKRKVSAMVPSTSSNTNTIPPKHERRMHRRIEEIARPASSSFDESIESGVSGHRHHRRHHHHPHHRRRSMVAIQIDAPDGTNAQQQQLSRRNSAEQITSLNGGEALWNKEEKNNGNKNSSFAA